MEDELSGEGAVQSHDPMSLQCVHSHNYTKRYCDGEMRKEKIKCK